MIRAIVSIALIVAAQAAAAATDYKCMGDCSAAGYQYGYCKRICSY